MPEGSYQMVYLSRERPESEDQVPLLAGISDKPPAAADLSKEAKPSTYKRLLLMARTGCGLSVILTGLLVYQVMSSTLL